MQAIVVATPMTPVVAIAAPMMPVVVRSAPVLAAGTVPTKGACEGHA